VELTEGVTNSTDEAQRPVAAPKEAISVTEPQQGAENARLAPEAQAPKKVIKKLALGQEMRGTVTRVADFGAFVDIGVNQDGLLHRTQIPSGAALKVGDIVQVCIAKVEAERGRISLNWGE